jgi:hypothetical protein
MVMSESTFVMDRSFEDQKQVQFNKNAKVLEHDVDQQSEHDSMSLDNARVFAKA